MSPGRPHVKSAGLTTCMIRDLRVLIPRCSMLAMALAAWLAFTGARRRAVVLVLLATALHAPTCGRSLPWRPCDGAASHLS